MWTRMPPRTLLTPGLNLPRAVAADAQGNVYIADAANNVVDQWNATTGQMTALVSSGLNGPAGVAVDGQGNVYIADTGDNAIREWVASTQQVSTLVSSGLSAPSGLAVDALGNVYFADRLSSWFSRQSSPHFYCNESAARKGCALNSAILNMLAPWSEAATGRKRKPGSRSALNESRRSTCVRWQQEIGSVS